MVIRRLPAARHSPVSSYAPGVKPMFTNNMEESLGL